MVGLCTDARFVEHDTGPYHPERPDRIRAIATAIRAAGLVDSPNPFPSFDLDLGPLTRAEQKLVELPAVPADEKWLATVHVPRHIEHVKQVCATGGGVLDEGDTIVGANSFDIALLALGAVLQSADAVMSGKVRRAFAAVRPPGHHAEPQRAMGFCLFANVAIAARYLQRNHGVDSVAIVDFDVHHGNGTQAAFEDDPSVLFISLHQDPRTCYPGTGFEWEVGEGPGRGTVLNLPFAPESTDADYLRVMEQRVLPKLALFRPQVLLLSAGFDAHRDDPLAQINLSEEGFEQITRLLVGAADAHCGGRVISVLEGGYNLRALGRSVVRHLMAMI